MSGKKKSEWVYDELLCFLGSAFFQVPVTSFIEANCLIFDPSVEDSQEYKKIHREYNKVVETLLDAFTKDSSLSHEEVIRALQDMNSKQDLREVFQGLFEQVLAMDDYTIFVPMMVQKNIELQQQALMLIIQTTGSLPDSLTEGKTKPKEPAGGGVVDDDEEIMRKVLAQSQREYDAQQKHQTRVEKKDKKVIESTIALSKAEVEQLEREKQSEQEKLNVAMANLMTKESNTSLKNIPAIQAQVIPEQKPKVIPEQKPVVKDSKVAMSDLVTHESNLASLKDIPPVIHYKVTHHPTPKVGPAYKPVVKESHVSVVVTPDPSQTSIPVGAGLEPKAKLPGISSSEAAANWLKSAQTESSGDGQHSSALQKAAAAMQGLSPIELQKRQEYLRQQRDKLVAMKKKEREKQLLTAEQSNPQRPMSARAARQTMDGNAGDSKKVSEEEQKKLDMRRAIANKLKAELMGSK